MIISDIFVASRSTTLIASMRRFTRRLDARLLKPCLFPNFFLLADEKNTKNCLLVKLICISFFWQIGKIWPIYNSRKEHGGEDNNDCGDKDIVYDTCVEKFVSNDKKITELAVNRRIKAYHILESFHADFPIFCSEQKKQKN